MTILHSISHFLALCHLLASNDTGARDDLVEAVTIPSRFRKNCDNWIFIFQKSQTTCISSSKKSAESEKSHQVVTRYVVNLSYFELGDKKSPVYDNWWLLVTSYFYSNVEINLKNIYKQNTYRMLSRIFLQETDFFKETIAISRQWIVSFVIIILEKIVVEFDTVSSRIGKIKWILTKYETWFDFFLALFMSEYKWD